MTAASVNGFCPMGCGPTLVLSGGGEVVCSMAGCPNPGAVGELLADTESEHLVTFTPDGWFTVRHPLHERPDDQLEECEVQQRLDGYDRDLPVHHPGRYRVRTPIKADPATWTWEPVS